MDEWYAKERRRQLQRLSTCSRRPQPDTGRNHARDNNKLARLYGPAAAAANKVALAKASPESFYLYAKPH